MITAEIKDYSIVNNVRAMPFWSQEAVIDYLSSLRKPEPLIVCKGLEPGLSTINQVFNSTPSWALYNLDFLDTTLIQQAWNSTGPLDFSQQVYKQAVETNSQYFYFKGIKHSPGSNYYTDVWIFAYDVPSNSEFNRKTRLDQKSSLQILRKYNGTENVCCWSDIDKNSYDFRALMNGHARLIEYIDFKDPKVPYNRMVSFLEGGVLAGKPNGFSSIIDKKGRHSMGNFVESFDAFL